MLPKRPVSHQALAIHGPVYFWVADHQFQQRSGMTIMEAYRLTNFNQGAKNTMKETRKWILPRRKWNLLMPSQRISEKKTTAGWPEIGWSRH